MNNFQYDDFAFYSISSSTTEHAAVLADFQTLYNYTTYYGPPANHLYNGHYIYSVWTNVQYVLPATGMFTLTFGSMNCGDNLYVSDLLVDNVTLNMPATVNDISYTGVMNQPVALHQSDFVAAFSDIDTRSEEHTSE